MADAKLARPMTTEEKRVLENIRERFVLERVCGFTGTNKRRHAPVSKEIAEERWRDNEVRFASVIMFDPAVRKRLNLK